MKQPINNFDDVLKYHGITAEEFAKRTEGMAPDTIAYEQLKLIVAAYNEKQKPDFTDKSQPKYEPWFMFSASGGFSYYHCDSWFTLSRVGSRLCYLNRDNMLDAVEKFKEVYNQYLA